MVNCSLCLSCWDGRPSRHWMLMGWPIQNLLNRIDHVLPAPHYPCGCSGCHGTGRGGSGCNILYPMLVAGVHPYMCVHVHVCVCVWNWWCGCSSSHVNVWYMYMYFAHTWMHTSMHNPPNPSSLPPPSPPPHPTPLIPPSSSLPPHPTLLIPPPSSHPPHPSPLIPPSSSLPLIPPSSSLPLIPPIRVVSITWWCPQLTPIDYDPPTGLTDGH